MLVALEQQMILYIHTCLSQVMRRKNISFTLVLTLTLILSFQFGQIKGSNFQNNWAFYIFTYNSLCLILKLLCSTAKKFKLHSLAMEQTGTVLDISNLTPKLVRTCKIV
jgi:hypothetical protein